MQGGARQVRQGNLPTTRLQFMPAGGHRWQWRSLAPTMPVLKWSQFFRIKLIHKKGAFSLIWKNTKFGVQCIMQCKVYVNHATASFCSHFQSVHSTFVQVTHEKSQNLNGKKLSADGVTSTCSRVVSVCNFPFQCFSQSGSSTCQEGSELIFPPVTTWSNFQSLPINKTGC